MIILTILAAIQGGWKEKIYVKIPKHLWYYSSQEIPAIIHSSMHQSIWWEKQRVSCISFSHK